MENNQSGFSGQGNQENQDSRNNRQEERNQDEPQRNSADFRQDDDFSINNENIDNISTGDYAGSESSSTLYEGSGSQSTFSDNAEMNMDDESREAFEQELNAREGMNNDDSRKRFSGSENENEKEDTQWEE